MAKKITIDIEVNGKMQKATVSAKKLRSALDETDQATTNVDKNTRTLDRNLKGAAKTTSNSTKEFSKMSQGMGGLVGAYATVAASVFALSAAFQFFKQAADLSALTAGQEMFASRTGTSMKLITSNIQDATGGLVAFKEAAQAAAIGQAAGLTADQMERLGKVAKNAGTILGRDVTDSFNRLTRGAIKAEPELLDELGIIIRLERATNEYAQAINKSANDLTQFEKTQAVVNAVLAQGEQKFQDVGNSVNQVARFGAAFQDTFKDLAKPVADIANFVAGALQDSIFAVSAVIGLLGLNIVKSFAPAGPMLKNTADEGIAARKRLMDAAHTETNSVIAGEIRKGEFTERNLKAIETAAKSKSSIVMNLSKMERAAIERDLAIIRAQNLRMTMAGQNAFSRMITSWKIQMLMFEAEYGKRMGRLKMITAAFSAGFSKLLSGLSVAGIMVMLVELGKQFRQSFLISPELKRAEKELEAVTKKMEEQSKAIDEVKNSLQPATSELNKFSQLFGVIANYNLNPLRNQVALLRLDIEALNKASQSFTAQESINDEEFRRASGTDMSAGSPYGQAQIAAKALGLEAITSMEDLEGALVVANQRLDEQEEKYGKIRSQMSTYEKFIADINDEFKELRQAEQTLALLEIAQRRIIENAGKSSIINVPEARVALTTLESFRPMLVQIKRLYDDLEAADIRIDGLDETTISELQSVLATARAIGAGQASMTPEFIEQLIAAADKTEALTVAQQKGINTAARANAAFTGLSQAVTNFSEATQKIRPASSAFQPIFDATQQIHANFETLEKDIDGLAQKSIADLTAGLPGFEGVTDEQSAGFVRALELVNKLRGEGLEELKDTITVEQLRVHLLNEEEKLLAAQFAIERAASKEKIRQVKFERNLASFLKPTSKAISDRNQAQIELNQAQLQFNINSQLGFHLDENRKKLDQDRLDLAKEMLTTSEEELKLQTAIAPFLARQDQLKTMQQVLNVQKEINDTIRKEQSMLSSITDIRMDMARKQADQMISDRAARDPFFDEAEARATSEVEILTAFEKYKKDQIQANYELKLAEIDAEYALLDAKRQLTVAQLKQTATEVGAQPGREQEAQALLAAANNLEGNNYAGAKAAAEALALATRDAALLDFDIAKRDAERIKESLNETQIVLNKAGDTFAKSLGDAFNGVMDSLYDSSKSAADVLKNTAKGVLTSIRDEMTQQFLVEPAKDFLSNLFGRQKEEPVTLENVVTAHTTAMDATLKAVDLAGKSSMDLILGTLEQATGLQLDILSAGGDIIALKVKEAIQEGITSLEAIREQGTPVVHPIPPDAAPGIPKIPQEQPTATTTHSGTSQGFFQSLDQKLDMVMDSLLDRKSSVGGRMNNAKKLGENRDTPEVTIKEGIKEGSEEGSGIISKGFEAAGDQVANLISSNFEMSGRQVAASLVSSLAGSVLDSFLGPALAATTGRYGGIFESYGGGGIARGRQAGYPAILHGTEAVVPLPNNNKIPVELNGAGSQQNNVTVNVNMETGTASTSTQGEDPTQGTNLGNALAAAVQAELQNQKRSGGILNPYGVS